MLLSVQQFQAEKRWFDEKPQGHAPGNTNTNSITNAYTNSNTVTKSNANTITNTATNNFKRKSGDLMRNPKATRLIHFANPSSKNLQI